jgi:ADP-heptose:LPS heptosyltransferase
VGQPTEGAAQTTANKKVWKMRERGNPALHLVDRWIGIPFVLVGGAVRRKAALPEPEKVRTVGLLKLSGIGDTVLMSGPVADLRKELPQARVVFFAARNNIEAARLIPGVDLVIEVPVLEPWRAVRAVRSVAVDIMLDFGQWARYEALLAVLSRAQCTVGFKTPGQFRHYGHDVVVEHSRCTHEIENFRNLVRALGVRATSAPQLSAAHGCWLPGPYAVFHLWPGGRRRKLKEWPLTRWCRLAEECAGWELDVVLTGSLSDRERNAELVGSVRPEVRTRVKNLAGISLVETCSVLANATFVVSVDTGIMHVAAALGAPLVALHGPTSARRWGPVGPNVVVIESPIEGCGYLHLGWEYPDSPPPCMESISFETVRDACLSVIQSRGQDRFSGQYRQTSCADAGYEAN